MNEQQNHGRLQRPCSAQPTVHSPPPTQRKRAVRFGELVHQKKAQLAVFLLIGILILISTAIVLYLQGRLAGQERLEGMIDEVPQEFQSLKGFIDTCITDTSMEGLRLIGLHGGYIGLEPKDTIYTKTSFQIDTGGSNPTAYDAVTFSEESTWKIPYWHYLISQNTCAGDCQFSTKQPPLYRKDGEHSIEAQLDVYVEENLETCLNEFEQFTQQGYSVTRTGEIEARTVIAKENVKVYVKYPIEVAGPQGRVDIKNFGTTLNLNLEEIYNLAADITHAQQQHHFLEANTMNIIAGFAGLDEEKLPPLAAADFSAKVHTWSESETEKKLQNQLAVYLQRFQVENTRNYAPYQFGGNTLAEGLYGNYILPIGGIYPNIGAEFTYLPSWPIYFDLGSEVVSTSQAAMNPTFSWLPIKQYNTPYDVSYPVVLALHDPTAFDNRGYTFYFALEANVRNNLPMDESFVPLRRASLGDIGQFCNPEQRNSGEITVEVKDSMGNPVEDAAIFFTARESCLIGSTALQDSRAVLTATFPVGIGAITVTHPDYFQGVQQFSTKLDQEDKVTIELQQVVDKEIKVMKKHLVKQGGWVFDPTPRPLQPNEKAIVTMERIKRVPYEEDFMRVVEVQGSNTAVLQLIPGRYNIHVQLLAEDTAVVIPEKKKCKRILLKKKCFTIPEMTVSTDTYNGGTTSIQNWELPAEYVYGEGVIRFHGLYFDLPGTQKQYRDVEDLAMLDKFDELVQQRMDELVPRLELR